MRSAVFGMLPFTRNRSSSQVSGLTSAGGGGQEGGPPKGWAEIQAEAGAGGIAES